MPDATVPIPTSSGSQQAVQRKHPYYARWEEDERKQRASYLATRRYLTPFLVPHRFEGNTPPDKLRRGMYGYGIGLNQAYLHEIFGHIRSTTSEYEYKPLTDTEYEVLTKDITGTGVSWRNFWEGTVLEWILTSTGGVIIIDAPEMSYEAPPETKSETEEVEGEDEYEPTPAPASTPAPAPVRTKADEQREGVRPYAKWVPMSKVIDLGVGDRGFRWIKLLEEVDERGSDGEGKICDYTMLYELLPNGYTQITRRDPQQNQKSKVLTGPFYDSDNQPMLPIIHAKFKQHPDLEWLGAGLLLGLDDIIIDLFNILSEVREAYRDAAFGLLVYTGDDYDGVKTALTDGSRLIGLGSMENAKLDRLAVDSAEVAAGLTLLDLGLKAWALAAKRKAAEAVEGTGDARSGISLQAEFQLDLKPLLVSIAETLDQLETQALGLLAQMYSKSPDQAATMTCKRNTDFRLEEEASRISRIVGEFTKTLPLPGEAKRQIILKWIEASGLVDMDEPLPTAETTEKQAAPTTAGDLIEQQVAATSDQQQQLDERPPEPSGFGFQ